MRFGDPCGRSTLSSILHRAHRSRRHAPTPASSRLELDVAISWALGSPGSPGSIATSQARAHTRAAAAQNAAPPSAVSNAWRAPSPRHDALPRPRARVLAQTRPCLGIDSQVPPYCSPLASPHPRASETIRFRTSLLACIRYRADRIAFSPPFLFCRHGRLRVLSLALLGASTCDANRDRVSLRTRCAIRNAFALTCRPDPATAMQLDARGSVGGMSWPRQR